MAEYVRMPKAHYEAACNSIRAKTGKTDLITSGAMSAEIDGITGGGGGGDVPAGYVTVTFMNGADVLFSRLVMSGDDCPDPYAQNRIELPTKESTAQYTYTFNGWATADGGSADSTALQNITADKTIYAAYTSAVRYYTVTYYDEDGVTVLKTEQLAYGSMPSYAPNKEGYAFMGWTPAVENTTADVSYVASFTEAFDFANATWEYIASVAEAGTASSVFALGDTKVITISLPDSDPIDMEVEIVGFNHDTLSDDSGTAGISIMTKYLMPEPRIMMTASTDRNNHRWEKTELRTFCNNTLFTALPETLRIHIKPVKKYSNAHYSGTIANGYVTDKCWVPSHRETNVTYSASDAQDYNGTPYEGYTSGVISLVKKRHGTNSAYCYWWYRSVWRHAQNTGYFFRQYSSYNTISKYCSLPNDTATYYCFGFCI